MPRLGEHMKTPVLLVFAVLVVAAGCGEEPTRPTDVQPGPDGALEQDDAAPARADRATARPKGTTVRVRPSEFGAMLFDSRRRAIYIFENDRKRRSKCYGACADAWPPVLTKGRPVAGRGADPRLLGTLERRGGKRQVTYAGQPLYYYAHEKPGEVRCHNVHLNGGLWWVIGPDGERRP